MCIFFSFSRKFFFVLLKKNTEIFVIFLKRYNLNGDDVRNEARFEDSIGIFPEFIDGYNILILPTTGRYFHVHNFSYKNYPNHYVFSKCI